MKHTAAILRGRFSGFALVVTLSLMILLTIVAVGLLTLASISLRSTSQGEAMATARANARLSLMVALGELQRQAGPDTRVTARADILDETHPPVLGAWRSWEGTNHETTGDFKGRPISPGSDYRSVKNGRFLAWLTSGAPSAVTNVASVPNTVAGAGKVTLLGEGSVGTEADRQIHLEPTSVSTGKQAGSMAWWIGGENQKAYLPKPIKLETNPALRRKQAVSFAKSNTVFDPNTFGLESVLSDPKRGTDEAVVNKVSSLNQSDFIAPDQSAEDIEDRRSRKHFHDLSTSAVGLLTNTATGGWRKDMSLLSERWNAATFPKEDLPFFRLVPDATNPNDLNTLSNFATTAEINKVNSLFYPWSSYTNFGMGSRPQDEQLKQHPVASWNRLMNFASFYKKKTPAPGYVANPTNAVTTIDTWSYKYSNQPRMTAADQYRHLHEINVYPIVARVQWIFSHASERVIDTNNPGLIIYNPKLLVTPVITLWNPYDVRIRHNETLYFDLKIMPVSLSYQIRPTENTRYNSILHVDGNLNSPTGGQYDGTPPMSPYQDPLVNWPGSGAIRIQYSIAPQAGGELLNPGQTIVYSPAAGARDDVDNSNNQIALQKGFRFTGGHLYPVKHGVPPLTTGTGAIVTNVPPGTPMKVRAKFDTEYRRWAYNNDLIQPQGVGVYLRMGTHPDPVSRSFVQTSQLTYSPAVANMLYPPIEDDSDLIDVIVDDVCYNDPVNPRNPAPFLTAIFGPRFTTKIKGEEGVIPYYAIKGLAQSTPFGNWRSSLYNDEVYPYTGTGHPHNSRFLFSFARYSSGGTAEYPGVGPANNGYIITGEQSDRGLPQAIIAELPARPLASLAELTHWDLRYENPAPPFAFNIIGNSDASPLLPPNAVVNSADASGAGIGQGKQNFRHDDSYCANHLLFDDWFFSTIAPDPATFGGSARADNVVFGEWLVGRTVGAGTQPAPLTNAAYKPIREDLARVQTEPTVAVYDDHVRPADSWKTIASRIEVEGMFNVNSTSVDAWKALLKHARSQRVLQVTSTGTYTGDTAVKSYPVTRSSIAGSVEAGGAIPGAFAEASEFIGYRTLDEPFIDELAEEIVRQVRLRGPFLSLAEFINRQLSDDRTLAIAGALQAALNELTRSTSSNNPLKTMQEHDVTSPSIANPPQGTAQSDQLSYAFPEAAVGHSSYGLPGWTRQADILRPIAPILSARDDTFTIRGYGDARDANNNVTAKAVCEVVVRRTRDYVDPADAADTTTVLTSQANKDFGRRFEIISFRWLAPEEV